MTSDDDGIDTDDIQMEEVGKRRRPPLSELPGRILSAIVISTVLFVALILGLGAGVIAVSWLVEIWP